MVNDLKSLPETQEVLNQEINTEQEAQIGKFIAIYPRNIEHLNKIVIELDEALLNIKEPDEAAGLFYTLVGDLQIGNSGGVFARYGVVAGKEETILEVNEEYIPAAECTEFSTHNLSQKQAHKAIQSAAKKGYLYTYTNFKRF